MTTSFPVKGPSGLSQGESPSKYDIIDEQNDIRSDAEGGYEARRPRYTRAGRTTIKTGFIQIKQADYAILRQFWKDHGTTVAFTYVDYMEGVTRQMRFENPPDWNPEAIGQLRLYSPQFVMKEV